MGGVNGCSVLVTLLLNKWKVKNLKEKFHKYEKVNDLDTS
jgi:hypothetical protein